MKRYEVSEAKEYPSHQNEPLGRASGVQFLLVDVRNVVEVCYGFQTCSVRIFERLHPEFVKCMLRLEDALNNRGNTDEA